MFRSEDGGQHWNKVLFVDDDTGAIDLAADPAHPDVIFAATWQGRSWPWLSYFMPQRGAGQRHLEIHRRAARPGRDSPGNGLPGGALGRIGLAVAPGTSDQRVYALIESAR